MALRRRGLNAEDGLAYFDWGLPEGIDLDDPANWRQANPAYGIPISDEVIRRERNAMTAAGFAPALEQQAASYRREPTTAPGVLALLEQAGVPRFAAEVRRHLR